VTGEADGVSESSNDRQGDNSMIRGAADLPTLHLLSTTILCILCIAGFTLGEACSAVAHGMVCS
jgi:hypothetical protein